MFDESKFPLKVNDYVFIKSIGNGGSAHCYLVESLKFEVNKLFVAKVIPFTQSTLITAENAALIGLNHPNIIKLYDRFTISSSYVLILEYCENKSLAEAIIPDIGLCYRQNAINSQQNSINLDFFKNAAYQIINALSFCHMKKCAHRDIKPSNVLIDHYGRLKLADFGLSIKYQNDNTFDCEYEYEYDEENYKTSKYSELNPDKNDASLCKCKVPLMTPITSDKDIGAQDTFETKIYYFNNVPLKRRKRSSDSEQTKLCCKNLDFVSSEKAKAKASMDELNISKDKFNVNDNKSHIYFKKKKRRKILCNSFCGSFVYTAPEIILRHSYDPFSADIWSLGVLFIVMLTGRSPWEGKGQEQIQEKILKGEISADVLRMIPLDAIELINKMVVVDPEMRFSIDQIKSSPYFDDPCILSSKSISSSQSHKKMQLMQQKSHSYNSNIAGLTHCRLQSQAKRCSQFSLQSQDNSPNLNSFKKLPTFRRPSQIQTSLKPVIQSSASLIRNQQQIKSPTANPITPFKKTPLLKSTLPVLNSSQMHQIEQMIIDDKKETNEETKNDDQIIDQEKEQNLIEQSESLQFLLQQLLDQQQHKNEKMTKEMQNEANQDHSGNGVNKISRCQSLFSPNTLHLH